MNVTAHQEKEENEETKKGKSRAGERKRENRRPILKKLRAALLRSFRGQHSEKMKGSARGNWDLREGQQPFRLNPNGAGDRTTTLRRLLIGADLVHCFLNCDNLISKNNLVHCFLILNCHSSFASFSYFLLLLQVAFDEEG